ncbi:MAG: cupin domain-containing protein [Candidatus Fimivivens sp.]
MNLFSIPEKIPEEFSQLLALSNNCRVERIVSQGHHSPENFWYTQTEDELIFLLAGNALLDFGHCQVFMIAGDMLLIPAHLKHRVEATSHTPPCVWLCIFGYFNHPILQETQP